MQEKLGIMATQALQDVGKSLDSAHDEIRHALGRAEFAKTYHAPDFTERLRTLLEQVRNLKYDVDDETPK